MSFRKPAVPPKRPPHLTTNSKQHLSSSASSSIISPPASAHGSAPSRSAEDRRPKPSKDAEGNINVVVRCRGRSVQEITHNAPLVASVGGLRGNSVTLTNPNPVVSSASLSLGVQTIATPISRTYDFGNRPQEGRDPLGNVFGPDADQVMLYNDVARPILDQVLQGYNCTIFAYGQTGTGKTYTMEGDLSLDRGISRSAGIIPRTLQSLFHKLAEDKAEFSVRCSFVELYNEELRDLNALEFSEPQSTTSQPMDNRGVPTNATASSAGGGGLRIYDDKNAGSGVVIQGLEETLITSAEEGLKVLKRGSERRQMAATKCNEQSSRSHSIFTITLHIKEASRTGGEDLLKVGKLNLVDLAGSENVGRSGAVQGRAREAGMINASLLALGRVINKLVEKEKHIPYRESKLTRLLQDSLGGRTKTTIIATISPVNFDETISTLDYALRAKTIQNRPEVNQRMTKNILLGQYATEIERLKADLLAAREKNGIFFSSASWAELAAEQEARRLALEESKKLLEINEAQLESSRDQFEQSMRLLGTREEELKKVGVELEGKRSEVRGLLEEVQRGQTALEEEGWLREAFERSRRGWKGAAGEAIGDVDGLRAKLARKTSVEKANLTIITNAATAFTSMTDELTRQLAVFKETQDDFVTQLQGRAEELEARQAENLATSLTSIDSALSSLTVSHSTILTTNNTLSTQSDAFLSLVEATRQELLTSLAEKATEAAERQKEQAAEILKGLQRHAEETATQVQAIVEPVRNLQVEAALRLAKDKEMMRLVQEEDRQALVDENARLHAVIAQLQASLDEERALAIDEDAELVALLSAKLAARSSRRADAFERTCDTAGGAVDEVARSREAQAAKRSEQMAEMEERNEWLAEAMKGRLGQVEQRGEESKKALAGSLEGVRNEVEVYQTAVRTIGEEQIEVVRRNGAELESGGATFRRDASTSKQMLTEQVDHLATSSRNGFARCKNQFGDMQSDVDSTSRFLRGELDAHSLTSTTFLSASTSHLSTLRSDIVSYLSSDIRHDLPTGQTPRKRSYKKDPLLAINVDLDGERSSVMDRLRAAQIQGGLDVALVGVPSEEEEFELTEGEEDEVVEANRPSSEEPDFFASEDEEEYQSPPPPAGFSELVNPLISSTGSAAPPGALKGDLSAPMPAVLGERDNNLRRSGRAAKVGGR